MRALIRSETRAKSQSGATAIEFALLFPLLFTVLYGGIVYGFIFFLQQRINFAAQEGVRAAIAVDPGAPGYNEAVVSQVANAAAQNTFASSAAGLPAALSVTSGFAVPSPCAGSANPSPGAGPTFTVCVAYNLTGPGPQQLFPVIDIDVLNVTLSIPNISQLRAQATGRLS